MKHYKPKKQRKFESGIEKLTEALSKIGNKNISEMITTIIRGAQELVKQLSTYPNGGIKEVEAFIKYSLADILYLMQGTLKGLEKSGN